jgi:hypothetical protein
MISTSPRLDTGMWPSVEQQSIYSSRVE